MTFQTLGLHTSLLEAVSSQGYTTPTPIQQKAIPVILKGRDILAGAQTGTGKTAAFALPVLQLLRDKDLTATKQPNVLILAPTRELAAQIGESILGYSQGQRVRTTVVFGGVNINPQINRLRQGVDIVVGTPGRLLDLANQQALDLSKIEILILDEADRMLDMGFIHDIRRLIKLVPRKRQTLFFSATYSQEIKKLADTLLVNPELVEVARQNTSAETVDHTMYKVPKSRKRDVLSHLIEDGNWNQVLVFTRTKHGANRLCQQLERSGIQSVAIHGNKSQLARTKALADFKAYKVRVLVATDIAARGLDIEKLPHVVNYDLPNVPEDYIHRIGRTGRAGSTGMAISLVDPSEESFLRAIERLMKKSIPVVSLQLSTIPVIKDAVPSFQEKRLGASGSSKPNARSGGYGARSQDQERGPKRFGRSQGNFKGNRQGGGVQRQRSSNR